MSLSTALATTLPSILAPAGSAALLAAVVLVHESGHFLAARSMGINVEEFSVGVGPRLIGFVKNDIEFSFRAFPLGGYVKFPPNYNGTLTINREIEADELRREQKRKIKDGNDKISFASKRTNNNEKNSISVPKPGLFSLIRSWKGKSSGKKVTTPNGVTLDSDGTINIPSIEYYDDPDLLQNRPWPQRAIVLVGGIVFNIILAFSLYTAILTIGDGIAQPIYEGGAVVTQNPRDDGACSGLLVKGDVILSINGKLLTSTTSPTSEIAQEGISRFITSIRSTQPGESLHLSVFRSSSDIPVEIDVTPLPLDKNDASPSIGVMLSPNFRGQTLIRATGSIDAVNRAAKKTYDITSLTASSLVKAIGGALGSIVGSSSKGASTGGLSGPIGLLRAGTDVASSGNLSAAAAFAAAVSINLAVVNSIPLPALDGGQLAFVLAEIVMGRKVDQKTEEAINSAFILLLLIVTFSTTIGDITAIVSK